MSTKIDRNRCEVKVQGELISLTPTEFDVLDILVKADGWVWSRQAIIDQLKRQMPLDTRSIDQHVARLRSKHPYLRANIITVTSKGYKYVGK